MGQIGPELKLRWDVSNNGKSAPSIQQFGVKSVLNLPALIIDLPSAVSEGNLNDAAVAKTLARAAR